MFSLCFFVLHSNRAEQTQLQDEIEKNLFCCGSLNCRAPNINLNYRAVVYVDIEANEMIRWLSESTLKEINVW